MKNEQENEFTKYVHFGGAFNFHGKLQESEFCYKKALAIKGDIPEVYNYLGEVFYKQGRIEEALFCVDKALELRPGYGDAIWGKAMTLLKKGDYAQGFRLYESRLARPEFSCLRGRKLWNGDYFSGKRLLVLAEQGFGDNIQFVRYLPQAKDRGGHVTLSTKMPLMRLFESVEGVDDLIEHKSVEDTYDYMVPLLSLPYIFGTTLKTIPWNKAYVSIAPELAEKWEHKITGAEKKVGFVWQGKTHYMPERSMQLEDIALLFNIPGITFYSLQKDKGVEEASKLSMYKQVVDLSNDIHDFADTAAIIAHMDVVITVDTAVAHLAGAMGKSVFLLLPVYADWRWLMDRADSPWYPTMRIFRQDISKGWQGLVKLITRVLQD